MECHAFLCPKVTMMTMVMMMRMMMLIISIATNRDNVMECHAFVMSQGAFDDDDTNYDIDTDYRF